MFDKKRCIENIYALAKEKNIMIRELEEAGGVSIGYLSRIKKDAVGTISVELLDSIADQLGVSLDYLVNCSKDEMSPNEQIVYGFLEKLLRMTVSGKLEWFSETVEMLNRQDASGIKNPFMNAYEKYSEEKNSWVTALLYYKSSLYNEGSVMICGNSWHAVLPNGGSVYLNCVDYLDGEDASKYVAKGVIEVYLYSGDIKPVCSTYYAGEQLKKAVWSLWNAVLSSPSRLALSEDTVSLMQDLIDMEI